VFALSMAYVADGHLELHINAWGASPNRETSACDGCWSPAP
jgi:hypothetical protein